MPDSPASTEVNGVPPLGGTPSPTPEVKQVTGANTGATPASSSPLSPADIGCFIRNLRGEMKMFVDPASASVFADDGWNNSDGIVDGVWCADTASGEEVALAIKRLGARGLVRVSNKTLSVATCLSAGMSFADADDNSFYLRKDN